VLAGAGAMYCAVWFGLTLFVPSTNEPTGTWQPLILDPAAMVIAPTMAVIFLLVSFRFGRSAVREYRRARVVVLPKT
jgi:hypothetical protein